jgi:hypothetical protein
MMRRIFMSKFYLQNDQKENIAEGVVFSNNSVAVSWLTENPSGGFYNSLFDLENLHRDLKVVREEESDGYYEPLRQRRVFEFGLAANGWVIREYESGSTFVASEESLENSEHEAFVSFLWTINSEFGPSDSKYSAERVVVSVVPGSDCEHARLPVEQVKDKVIDHLDYCLRFLRNVDQPTDELSTIQKELDEILDRLWSQHFATIDP